MATTHNRQKDDDVTRQKLAELEAALRECKMYADNLEKSQAGLLTINRISSTVSQSLELGNILESAVDNIIELLHVDAAWIYLLNEEKNELELAAHRNYSEEYSRIKVGYGISGRVAMSGEPILVEDVSKAEGLLQSVKEQMSSLVVVPLTSKAKVNGTLGVNSRSHRFFEKSEIELLSIIGNQIGVAVDNAVLYNNQLDIAEKLRASEGRYRTLFESALDAIWINDLKGNLVQVNKVAEDLLGFSIEELMKNKVKDLLPKESLPLAIKIGKALLAGEEIEQPYEQYITKKDGTPVYVKMTTTLIKENGKPMFFMHIGRDVTREKELQQELQTAYQQLSESHEQLKLSQQQLIHAEKLTSLGQLAASIAHEVNNPLAGVLLYTQLLEKKIRGKNEVPIDTAMDYLSKMEFELVRSTRLIRDLMDFAKQTPLEFQEINLNSVMDKALDLIAHSAKTQHIEVTREFDPKLPPLMGDSHQLHQVFTNLILNAVQVMPDGGKLTLSTSVTPENEIKAEVTDTGCGIPPENMGKLFTPFFTTKSEVKGVGLGLAVSYGIIKNHKGRIEVASEVNKGTTFSVYLPLKGT
jgi:two-component system NtrC family sensor kinase